MKSTLVLPSSLGTTAELWDANRPFWSRTFELRAYAQRGRGSVQELGRDLLALSGGADRVSICGLSLGGATAMCVAASEPERVDRLVLACTSADFGEPEPWLQRAALVRARGFEPIADGIVARWFTPAASPELVARFRRILVATPRDEYAACCEALARWDFRDRLGEIEAPTLVIAGAEDHATPPEHAELLAAGIPNARLVVLPDAAHLANVERAEEFATLVSEHLAPVEVG